MQSGTYRPKLDVKVTAWPLPDANGDGDPVLDDNGGEVKDAGGNVIKEYDMPSGYDDIHGDGVGIKVNRKGDPVRDVEGNAVSLAPGGCVVEFPDGRIRSLDADEAVEFARAYTLHSDSTPAPSSQSAPSQSASSQSQSQTPPPVTSDPQSGDGNSAPSADTPPSGTPDSSTTSDTSSTTGD